MRKRLIAVVAVTALLGSGLVAAAAAGLGPLSSGIFSASGPVTYDAAVRSASDLVLASAGDPATVSGLTLTISGPDLVNLNGQEVSIALLDSAGVQIQLVTATLVSGTNLSIGATTATISLAVAGNPPLSSFAYWAAFVAGVQALGPFADPTARVVTVGNGSFPVVVTPVDWQTLLVTGGNGTDAIASSMTVSGSPGSQCVTIGVDMTGSNNHKVWELALDYSAGPFWGVAPVQANITNAMIKSTSPTTHILGGTAGNEEIRRTDDPIYIVVCQNDTTPPPDAPDAYTVSPQSRGTWTDELACARRTVTGNNTYPFYFGWSVALDLTDAYARLRLSDPGAPRSFAAHPNLVSPAFDSAVTGYTVTNSLATPIAGTQSYVVELCASRS